MAGLWSTRWLEEEVDVCEAFASALRSWKSSVTLVTSVASRRVAEKKDTSGGECNGFGARAFTSCLYVSAVAGGSEAVERV
jgi:hypothetical protein